MNSLPSSPVRGGTHRGTTTLASTGAAALAAALMLPAAPALAAKDVVAAVYSTFTTTDPYDANDNISLAVAKSFYEGLFGFDKDMKMVPVLAESHQASADGMVFTITLRQGVKFHDGTPFDAQAVKVNFDRVTNPDSKLKRYNLYKNIAKTEVVDARTVRFTMKEPFSPFLNTLAHPSGVIISPAALEKYGRDIAQHPVGTGPYEFVEWKTTDYLKVRRNPDYWRAGHPKVDSITWRPVVDNNTRAAVVQTGEAQFAYTLSPESVATLRGKPDLVVDEAPSIIQRYLSLNTRQKPFDNVKVREAINYAINKDALVKVAFSGFAVPAQGVLPPALPYAQKLGPWPYDVARARALLKEAGYPNGFETTLWSAYNHTTAQKVIQFVQQQLAQVGIKVQVQALEAGQRVERVESASDPATAPIRMYYVGWSASTGEPDWALRPLLASESFPPRLYNTAYYHNETVDRDIADALKTTSEADKTRLYTEAQKQIWADAPWAFLVTETNVSVHSKRLKGMNVMPDQNLEYGELDLD